MALNINALNAANINFTIPELIIKENADFVLTSTDGTINGKVDKIFSGGKSGDTVLRIQVGNVKYVLKVFNNYKTVLGQKTKKTNTNKNAQLNEIQRHITFMGLFNGYKPCPVIYCYGRLRSTNPRTVDKQNSDQQYFIMEYSSGPELDQHIGSICEGKNSMYNTNLYNDVNMIHIIMELFYIICKMILANFTHCDLHTKNIIIVKTTPSTLNFNDVGINASYTLSGYRLKVLDFGLSVEGVVKETVEGVVEDKPKQCDKKRDMSSALKDLRVKCKGSKRSGLMRVIRGEMTNAISYKANTDLLFFCNILKALKTSGKPSLQSAWIQKVDIDAIRDIAEYIVTSNKEDKKGYLLQIYEELTKHIPKKYVRHRLCITNHTKSGNSGSITYKSKRISNANKNKNKTCKNYNVSTNSNTTTIIKV
jgi:tRNA A-37 threonylcarbamoyl transferase component Bud32